MASNSESDAIVRALVGLGAGLGLEVIAEGVESDQQRLMLIAHGCGHGQERFVFRGRQQLQNPIDQQRVGACGLQNDLASAYTRVEVRSSGERAALVDEACSTVHLSSDQLQPMDLPFYHAVTPCKSERSVDGVAISFEPPRERRELRLRSGLKPLWPRSGIAVADHLEEASGSTAECFRVRIILSLLASMQAGG